MCERVGEDATEAGERDRERDGVMKCDTERVGRGWSCSCVSAHEGCTISAAAQVKLDSNPRIKNLCWFAKPDYWHFPTFLYCHPTVRWPLHALNFCHLQRKWPPVIYLFIYAYTNVFSVINTQGCWTVKREKKRSVGRRILTPTQSFYCTPLIFALGVPLSALLAFKPQFSSWLSI